MSSTILLNNMNDSRINSNNRSNSMISYNPADSPKSFEMVCEQFIMDSGIIDDHNIQSDNFHNLREQDKSLPNTLPSLKRHYNNIDEIDEYDYGTRTRQKMARHELASEMIISSSPLSTTSTTRLSCYDSSSVASSHNTNNQTIQSTKNPADAVRVKHIQGLPLTDTDIQVLLRDRQKKDNHNLIERRRRFNINDKIRELCSLLPGYLVSSNINQKRLNKGVILRESVEYIKQLRIEVHKLQTLQSRYEVLRRTAKDLVRRLQVIETNVIGDDKLYMLSYTARCKINELLMDDSSLPSIENLTKREPEDRLRCEQNESDDYSPPRYYRDDVIYSPTSVETHSNMYKQLKPLSPTEYRIRRSSSRLSSQKRRRMDCDIYQHQLDNSYEQQVNNCNSFYTK